MSDSNAETACGGKVTVWNKQFPSSLERGGEVYWPTKRLGTRKYQAYLRTKNVWREKKEWVMEYQSGSGDRIWSSLTGQVVETEKV